jgi:hypothetical protein
VRLGLKDADRALGCNASVWLVPIEIQAFFHGKLAQPEKLFKNTGTG